MHLKFLAKSHKLAVVTMNELTNVATMNVTSIVETSSLATSASWAGNSIQFVVHPFELGGWGEWWRSAWANWKDFKETPVTYAEQYLAS